MLTRISATLSAWRASWRRRRIVGRTARAADLLEDQPYDLLLLHARGFVRARGTGQSITNIHGEIENLIDKPLRVTISPGTYFVASGNCQNMVTRAQHSITLAPVSTRQVSIEAACINAHLPIPGERDRFYGVRRVSEDLARFLEASRHADAMTVQSGVWALTDAYTGEDVKNHLVVQDRHGNRRPAVNDHHIEAARRILLELGIRTGL